MFATLQLLVENKDAECFVGGPVPLKSLSEDREIKEVSGRQTKRAPRVQLQSKEVKARVNINSN